MLLKIIYVALFRYAYHYVRDEHEFYMTRVTEL